MWMESLKLDTILNWHRVCSKHFKPQCFKSTTGLKRTLWPNAIPSLDVDQNTTEVVIVNLYDEKLENDYLIKK